jgi:hypothetical protein
MDRQSNYVKFYWWSELLPWPLSGKPQHMSPYLAEMADIVKILRFFTRKIQSRKIKQT